MLGTVIPKHAISTAEQFSTVLLAGWAHEEAKRGVSLCVSALADFVPEARFVYASTALA